MVFRSRLHLLFTLHYHHSPSSIFYRHLPSSSSTGDLTAWNELVTHGSDRALALLSQEKRWVHKVDRRVRTGRTEALCIGLRIHSLPLPAGCLYLGERSAG